MRNQNQVATIRISWLAVSRQASTVGGKAAIQPTIPTLTSQCPVLSRLGSHKIEKARNFLYEVAGLFLILECPLSANSGHSADKKNPARGRAKKS